MIIVPDDQPSKQGSDTKLGLEAAPDAEEVSARVTLYAQNRSTDGVPVTAAPHVHPSRRPRRRRERGPPAQRDPVQDQTDQLSFPVQRARRHPWRVRHRPLYSHPSSRAPAPRRGRHRRRAHEPVSEVERQLGARRDMAARRAKGDHGRRTGAHAAAHDRRAHIRPRVHPCPSGASPSPAHVRFRSRCV